MIEFCWEKKGNVSYQLSVGSYQWAVISEQLSVEVSHPVIG